MLKITINKLHYTTQKPFYYLHNYITHSEHRLCTFTKEPNTNAIFENTMNCKVYWVTKSIINYHREEMHY